MAPVRAVLVGRLLLIEKELVVFVLSIMFFEDAGELADKAVNFRAGKTLSEGIGKFWSTNQLEKAGKRADIQFTVQTKTDLIGGKGRHGKIPGGED